MNTVPLTGSEVLDAFENKAKQVRTFLAEHGETVLKALNELEGDAAAEARKAWHKIF